MQIAPILVTSQTFQSYLSENSFYIPELQRPFAWDDEQVMDFIKDVKSVTDLLRANANAEPRTIQHFFGTLVLQNAVNPLGKAIIDGQQRITAVSLTLAILLQEFRSLLTRVIEENNPEFSAFKDQIGVHIAEVASCLKTSPNVEGVQQDRLKPSPEIAKTYASYVHGGDGEIQSESDLPAFNLRHAAGRMKIDLICDHKQYLGQGLPNQLKHLVRVKQALMYSLVFVVVETQSSQSAYQLFESLNSTGEPLNAIDLLKVWVMAEMQGHSAEKFSSSSMRALATQPNDRDKPEDYLFTYFLARTYGRSPDRSKPKRFVLDTRNYLFKDPLLNSDDPTENLQEQILSELRLMLDWRITYQGLIANPIVYPFQSGTPMMADRLNCLLGTKFLGHKTSLPLMLTAAAFLEPQDFFELVHAVERLFFRVKIICGKRETYLKALYAKWMEEMASGEYEYKKVVADCTYLIGQHASDSTFDRSLRETLNGDGNRLYVRYFFWMLELHSANPAPAEKVMGNWSVEHIHPQNPELPDEELDDETERLGNLCLLTTNENAQLSNHNFAMKAQIVAANRLKAIPEHLESGITRSIFDNLTWTRKEIDIHEDFLVAMAKTVFRVS